MNSPVESFDLRQALFTWLVVVLALAVLALLIGWIFSVLSRGLRTGTGVFLARLLDIFRDLAALSGRRLWAIVWYSVLESLRRRILLVFGIFALLFLFAGWYLPNRPTEQVRVYVSFVMMCSLMITMIAMILVAAMSLPSDIRSQTIHTVVTKPVRRLEIVLGRIVGFTIVATGMLLIMGVVSYIYMQRSVNGSLQVLERQRELAEQRGDAQRQQQLADDIEQINSKRTARVPIYGKLGFRDQQGEYREKSRSVGEEVAYRSYIQGNTTEAAVWHFTDLPVKDFIRGGEIPIELTFTVFRTTKGIVGEGVVVQLTYRNPKTGQEIVELPFEIREYYVNQTGLGGGAPDDPELVGLLEGCEGELDIEARCLSATQYMGMADPDLYILQDNASFGLNFLKGMFGVWLRVFLIICVAVTASTVLSGPVAILATVAVFLGALQMSFLQQLAAGENLGGGPAESIWRLVTHKNLVNPIGEGFWVDVGKGIDKAFGTLLKGLTYILPDLGWFNTTPLVAEGFDISLGLVGRTVLVALGYAVPFTLTAYLLLQTREIAG